MGLESGNYINDLVITNPLGSDGKNAGDDHLRLLKTVLKECFAGFTGAILITATDTGTAGAHVLTPSTALVGYTNGLMLLYRPVNAGTGALTVNVSGLGAKNVKTLLGADPTSGDIVANQPILMMYDGTNFVIIAGSEMLLRTGNQTITGNLTMVGAQTITGSLAVSGALTGASMTAKANKAGETYSGPQDFTGATITAATQVSGTSTADVATCAFVVAQAFSAILPGQTGNAGKVLTTDGTNASWAAGGARTVKNTTYSILASDLSKDIVLTGTNSAAWTVPNPATITNGWYCTIKNEGATTLPCSILLQRFGSETIDGQTSIAEYNGGTLLLKFDGTNFFTVRLTGGFVRCTSSTTIFMPTRVSGWKLAAIGGGGGGAGGATSGTNFGAAGGGGGAFMQKHFSPIATSAALTVTVGAGGTGSAGSSGAIGNSGGATSVTSGGVTYISAYGGGGGTAPPFPVGGGGGGALSVGGSAPPNGGSPNVTVNSTGPIQLGMGLRDNISFGGAGGAISGFNAGNAEYGGAGGGSPLSATAINGGSSMFGGGGGGGGTWNGGAFPTGVGGLWGAYTSGGGGAAGTGNVASPTAGTAGTSRDYGAGDGGGGGGYATGANTGGAGGNGGLPGGGAGGGGSSNSGVGGVGGNGGRGELRLEYW